MTDESNQAEEQQTPVITWDINKARIADAAETFKDIDAYVDLDAAKKAKKVLTKMRTKLAEDHKETKAEALAFGRKVDAKKNEYLGLIKEIEDPISDQLTEIKEKAEREKQDRVDAITARIQSLSDYAEGRHSLTIDEMKQRRENLMAEDLTTDEGIAIYEEFLEQATMARDEAELKLRLAIDRETTRLKEEAEQAEQRAENERRQKELDDRQAQMDQEEADRNAKQDAEDAERKAAQKVIDDAAAAEQKEKDDKRQAELDKQAEQQRVENERIATENARLAKEKADKEESDRQEQEEREAAERALRLAPDTDKLEAWAVEIDQCAAPSSVESDEAQRVATLVIEKLQAVTQYIRNEARKMK